MNAMNDDLRDGEFAATSQRSDFAPAHRTSKFATLLRREYWEHKGGFVWAPVAAGALFLLFSILGGGASQMFLQREKAMINIDGKRVSLAEMDWSQLLQTTSPKDLEQMRQAINGMLMVSAVWPMLIFGFVVFFYLLGALYDERRDRSVLFWKSLPVSDTTTVLSKVVTAVVVAPLIVMAVGLVTMLGFIVIVALFAVFNGIPVTLFLSQIDPLRLLGSLMVALPIYILWALPTVGWLLMCSAWARTKPFLWAVLLPVLAGVLISMFNLLRYFELGSGWFWQNIVARLLTSAWPGSHLWNNATLHRFENSRSTGEALRAVSGVDLLSSPGVWIGAAAGIAMIYMAIRLRRWRDDG